MGLIEKYGSGIRRVVNYFALENRPLPIFQNQSSGFIVTLFSADTRIKALANINVADNTVDYVVDNTLDYVAAHGAGNVVGNVVENVVENKIIELITINHQISATQIAETIKLSSRSIQRYLMQLKTKGIINRIGPDKGGFWEVINKKK